MMYRLGLIMVSVAPASRVAAGDAKKDLLQTRAGRSEVRARGQLRDGAVGDLPAPVHDDDAGADFFHQMQEMRRHDDGGAGAAACEDGFAHPADADRIESCQRLVEQQHRRVAHEAAGDDDLLAHAARQLAGERPLFPGELELVQERSRPALDIDDAVQPGDQPEVLVNRQVLEQVRLIRHECQPALGFERIGDEVVAIDADMARGGAQDARQRPEGRRLAGAVGADEAHDFSRRDLERQIVNGGEIDEDAPEVLDGNRHEEVVLDLAVPEVID